MASKCDQNKQRRYDLSMSRRTRKPVTIGERSAGEDKEQRKPISIAGSSQDGDEEHQNSNGFHRASLKELMKERNVEEKIDGGMDQSNGVGGGHMEVPAGERSLSIVAKQNEPVEGTRMGMVSRYIKVLNHMIKSQRGSKKRSKVPLLMQ